MSRWVLCLVVGLSACGGEAPPAAAPPAPAADTEAADEPDPSPPPTEDKYAASQILVAWKGAVNAPAAVTRTEAEAHQIAEELRRRAVAGEDFAALAKSSSDSPSGKRGGSVGVYLTGTMVPEFEAAVASVKPGEIGPLARSPFGWHVVRRDAIVEARISHLLVSWHDAEHPGGTARTRDEAGARVAQALARIDRGEPFATVAREMSDDPSGADGGDLGVIAPGQMDPAFEDAAFALKPGEHSGVVETPYGFHVLYRPP